MAHVTLGTDMFQLFNRRAEHYCITSYHEKWLLELIHQDTIRMGIQIELLFFFSCLNLYRICSDKGRKDCHVDIQSLKVFQSAFSKFCYWRTKNAHNFPNTSKIKTIHNDRKVFNSVLLRFSHVQVTCLKLVSILFFERCRQLISKHETITSHYFIMFCKTCQ